MPSKYTNTEVLQNWICIRVLLWFCLCVCVYQNHPNLKNTHKYHKIFFHCNANHCLWCCTRYWEAESITGVNYRAHGTCRKGGSKPLCQRRTKDDDIDHFHGHVGLFLSVTHLTPNLTHQEVYTSRDQKLKEGGQGSSVVSLTLTFLNIKCQETANALWALGLWSGLLMICKGTVASFVVGTTGVYKRENTAMTNKVWCQSWSPEVRQLACHCFLLLLCSRYGGYFLLQRLGGTTTRPG